MISRNFFTDIYPIKCLGEVVEFLDSMRRPVTESDRRAGNYPYYGANGLQGTIDDYIFDEPLVLLAEDGGHFGNPKRGIAYQISGKTWVNNHAHVLRPKESIDLAFLCRVLENYDVTPFVTGTTRGKLTQAGAAGIPIPIPPIAEQKRIAEILDRTQSLISKRKEAIALLDILTQSIFIEMFGDNSPLESKWNTVSFGDLLEVLTDYHANGSYEILRDNVVLKKQVDYALMVRTTDLENNNFDDECIYIDKKAYDFLSKSKVYGGEIIINKIGSAGKVYLMPYLDRPVSLGMNAFLIRLNNKVNTSFIYHFLTSSYGKEAIDKNVKGAVTKTITKEAIRGIKTPVPPLPLQKEFAQRVEAVEKLKATHHASLSELQALFASLQHRAFRGEL